LKSKLLDFQTWAPARSIASFIGQLKIYNVVQSLILLTVLLTVLNPEHTSCAQPIHKKWFEDGRSAIPHAV